MIVIRADSLLLKRLGGVRSYAPPPVGSKLRLDGVKDVIAVASAKGGVTSPPPVGLLDADIYGLSIPTMTKIERKSDVTEDKKMIPIENYGIKFMSMGFLEEKDAPIVWRVPMILGFVEKMSCFKCPHCGEPWFIFGEGGSRKTADSLGYNFLGEIPLEIEIRKGSDEGVPMVIAAPDSVVSRAYTDAAQNVINKLEELAKAQPFHLEINL